MRERIYIAIGSNLKDEKGREPADNCRRALRMLDEAAIEVRRRSPWYESPPEDGSAEPWYVNGVAEIGTDLDPRALLEALHRIEERMGRVRRRVGESRVIDLDLIDYGGRHTSDGRLQLPHPRMAGRAFVLLPLADIAPGWCHPSSARPIRSLIEALPPTPIRRR